MKIWNCLQHRRKGNRMARAEGYYSLRLANAPLAHPVLSNSLHWRKHLQSNKTSLLDL